MEQSFRKSQLLRNESEKYLNSRSKKEQRSKATSYSEFMQNTKYQSTASTKYASFGQLQPRKRILPHVLKVSDNLLHDKQSTKNNLQ